METIARLNNLRVSPRKVRLLADLVKGMKVNEAALQLEFSRKHAARPVLKLLRSAMANATHNHKLDVATLVVANMTVDSGETLHRWMPRAMGRATPIRKRSSKITLTLRGESGAGEVSVPTEQTETSK